MFQVAPQSTLTARSVRAPFKYPVRVTIAGERVVRVLSGDISPNGMFVQMAEPPEAGTVVVLAFEVKDKVLPFAEGEVAWRRGGEAGGFGVRFTRFLHPRAQALVDFLSSNVEQATELKVRPIPAGRRRWQGLAAMAAAVTALFASSVLAPTLRPAQPEAPVAAVTCGPPTTVEVQVPVPVPQECPAPVVTAPAPAAGRKLRRPALPEAPKGDGLALARTVQPAPAPVRFANFSSTPIPSGAARVVTLSKASHAVRVAVEPVAGGRVTAVRALANPARLVMDVSGLPPIGEHVLGLKDPAFKKLTVTKQGKQTRLVVELARAPSKLVQQGDSALLSF